MKLNSQSWFPDLVSIERTTWSQDGFSNEMRLKNPDQVRDRGDPGPDPGRELSQLPIMRCIKHLRTLPTADVGMSDHKNLP